VPTDLLAAPAFRVAVIASISCFCGQILSYIALPFYLQHTLHMTPVLAGLYMMPWPAEAGDHSADEKRDTSRVGRDESDHQEAQGEQRA
ncbi:hypothetical protein ACC692_37315, partial [Rhizobium ruizarguesonis]